MGPILDKVIVSHDVEGASYEESGDTLAHFYYAYLLRIWSQATLPPWLLHHGAIKLVVAPTQPTSSHMISHRLPTSFPMTEKKKRDRETDLEK
jgi:hypothetical protein